MEEFTTRKSLNSNTPDSSSQHVDLIDVDHKISDTTRKISKLLGINSDELNFNSPHLNLITPKDTSKLAFAKKSALNMRSLKKDLQQNLKEYPINFDAQTTEPFAQHEFIDLSNADTKLEQVKDTLEYIDKNHTSCEFNKINSQQKNLATKKNRFKRKIKSLAKSKDIYSRQKLIHLFHKMIKQKQQQPSNPWQDENLSSFINEAINNNIEEIRKKEVIHQLKDLTRLEAKIRQSFAEELAKKQTELELRYKIHIENITEEVIKNTKKSILKSIPEQERYLNEHKLALEKHIDSKLFMERHNLKRSMTQQLQHTETLTNDKFEATKNLLTQTLELLARYKKRSQEEFPSTSVDEHKQQREQQIANETLEELDKIMNNFYFKESQD